MKKLITLVMFLCLCAVGWGATYLATESGNASTITWNPALTFSNLQTDDILNADGFNVTIDQDFTCSKLINTTGTGTGFTCTATRTITCDVEDGVPESIRYVASTSGSGNLTINGNVYGTDTNSAGGVFVGNGTTLTVNGNVYAGGANWSHGIDVTGTVTVIVNGIVRGNDTSYLATGVEITSGGTYTIEELAYESTLSAPIQMVAGAIGYTSLKVGKVTIDGVAVGVGGYRSRYR